TGLLCPVGDPQAFATAIARVLDDATLAARLVAAARARIEESFSVTRLVDHLEALYSAQNFSS
ncbi:MAG: glycosyltransferase, partial [Planctomycetota bacterium]